MPAGKSQAKRCYFWDVSHLDSVAVGCSLRECSVFDRIWQKSSLTVKYHWIPSSTSTRASGNWLTCGGWRSRSCRRWCWRDRDFLRFRRRRSPGRPSPQQQPPQIPTGRMQTLPRRWCRGGSRPRRLPRASQDVCPLPSPPPWAQDRPFLTPVLRTLPSRPGRGRLSPRVKRHRRDTPLSLYRPTLRLCPRDLLAFLLHILVSSSSRLFGCASLKYWCFYFLLSPPIRDLL